ncbi:MAG: efflux RND transporter periplasmic adaptor subunit [Cyanobacteria bacterium HKST-UBA02]|nr:efflux RND transporter periplasmic adaptor subunit [Cyanobacteria bacterium HKST-UBA02]
MKFGHYLLPVIAGVLLTLSACSQMEEPKRYILPGSYSKAVRVSVNDEQEKEFELSTATTSYRIEPVEIQAAGELEVNQNKTVPVLSLIPGNVEDVKFQLGSKVRTGQSLATIRSDEIAQLEWNLIADLQSLIKQEQQNLADRELAEKVYERKKVLFEAGINPKAEVEKAETELKKVNVELDNIKRQRQSAIESTRERLKLFGLPASELERLLSSMQAENLFDVTSPSSGTITCRNVNPGQRISSSEKLFEVSDLSSLWLIANIFEKDALKIKVGEAAKILFDAMPGKEFDGVVDYIGPELNEDTRTLPIRAEIPNASGLLRPKMYARMTILVGEKNALVIPCGAVQKAGEENVVYLKIDKNTFEERHVKLGREFEDSTVEILRGLELGDQVASHGSLRLRGLVILQSAN